MLTRTTFLPLLFVACVIVLYGGHAHAQEGGTIPTMTATPTATATDPTVPVIPSPTPTTTPTATNGQVSPLVGGAEG